ncbi:MAG: ABC transporter ATP-binding protein [Saprospiraceae bacterium]|nr:ABC transporter ATP-binding protein [Saprospiraceae bacterium]
MQDIKQLVHYLLRYKGTLSLSIFCHVLMAVFTVISIPLVIPFFQLLFTDSVDKTISKPDSILKIIDWLKYYFIQVIESQGTSKALMLVCGLIVITFFFKNLFRYLAMFFMVSVRSSTVRDLRSRLYSRYLENAVRKQNGQKRGDLIARIISDVQEVEWSILRFIDAIFKSPIVIIGSILIMLSINVNLTLFVFILMAFTTIVIGSLSRTLKKQSMSLQQKLSKMTSIVDETIDGALLIKVFRVSDYWKSRFERLNESFRNTLNRVSWRQDLSSPLSEFLGVSLVVVLLWYGSHLVLNGSMASEDFFAFIFAFYNVIEPSKSFATAYYNVRKGSAALQRIDEQLNIPLVEREIAAGTKSFKLDHGIYFKNVSFSYGNDIVLNQLDMAIAKGEKVAIIGPSGAGKTTIMMLLMKMLQADSGHVLIDDTPLNNISKDSLFEKIGLVTQDPFLFNASVEDNITLGRNVNNTNQIENSLQQAHAFDFVKRLEGGTGNNIGDRGDQLSGGEKQRLTIARALLEDPDLLILDEPTSALDPESEEAVSQAILSALKDRTAIIIAHRMSTVKYADRILVLKKGKIAEQGTHIELMEKKGIYADYVKIQSID